MVYGYTRVSSKGQITNYSLEQQKQEIYEKYETAIIIEEQYTATTTDRPMLNGVITRLQCNDILVVTKLDRLARTTVEGVELIQALFERGVSVHVLNIGLLDNTSMGKFFITTLLAVAELERNQIVERTQSGREQARLNPTYKEGRPHKYGKAQINHALDLLEGKSYKEVERLTGISKSTLIRARRASLRHGDADNNDSKS